MKLSPLEQSSRLRTIYTQLCFCYAAPYGYEQAQIVERLVLGLSTLTEAIPWLAGQVVEQNGGFSVVPFQDLPQLTVKDLTLESSVPTLRQLENAKFPFSMLDEKLFCPRSTLSDGPGEDEKQPYLVLLLQVSFIKGGIILAILACHSVMDIVGQVQIIRLFSQACHGTPFSDETIADCTLDRENLIPLLDTNEKDEKFNAAPARAAPAISLPTPTVPITLPQYEWAYFRFDASALGELKDLITTTLPEPTSFVSTDDSICALLWQCLAHVRLARLHPATPLHFLRQVDVRKYMGIPDTYLGGMVTSVTTSFTLGEVASTSLGALASSLRALLDPPSLVHSVRVAATEATTQPGQRQTTGSSSKKKDRENTITMSSWSKASCNDVNFNLGLGVPMAVRRPMFTPIEGVVYLLPKGKDGETLAGLCLREGDMGGLRKNKEFCRWVEYIG